MDDINGRGSVFGTVHSGTSPGGPFHETTGLGSGERVTNAGTSFHTYAVELDRNTSDGQLRYYLDGNNHHTVRASQVPEAAWDAATHHGYFVILDVAMRGGFPDAFGGGPTAVLATAVRYVSFPQGLSPLWTPS